MIFRGQALVTALLTVFLASATVAKPQPGTISFQFEKRRAPRLTNPPSSASLALHKRQDGTINVEISNFGIIYLINVTIGTPPQPLSLILDTGSSDLWVPAIDSDVCSLGFPVCAYGSLNPSDSSTFTPLEDYGPFYIEYVDGTSINGSYFSDTLTLSNTPTTNATMALAAITSNDIGVMGIGFSVAVSSNTALTSSPFTYPTILDNLLSQNHISSRIYSLWLDDLADDTGRILFGGIDTEKYIPPLISLPIQNDTYSGIQSSFTVTWTGLTISLDFGDSAPELHDFSPSQPEPIILDSGSTLTYLPGPIAERIFNALGVSTDPLLGNVVPCNIKANNISFTYTFGSSPEDGGAQITVPLSELLLELVSDQSGTPYTGPNEDPSDPPLCQFGIESAEINTGAPLIFGDTFLRSAYVVYDLENYAVALAQTNFLASVDESDDEIMIVESQGAEIPEVSSTASGATVLQTFTGFPAPGTAEDESDTRIVSRSATLDLRASGTVPPSATATALEGTRSENGIVNGPTSGRGGEGDITAEAGSTATSDSAAAGNLRASVIRTTHSGFVVASVLFASFVAGLGIIWL